jgi:predicted nucleotidyltransferase
MAQPRITIPADRLAEFCRRNHIRQLSLFGSVLRDDFGPDSDVDVLVEFEPEAQVSLFDLAAMQNELRAIIGREVDLVERAAVEQSENYIRRKSILATLETVYAA